MLYRPVDHFSRPLTAEDESGGSLIEDTFPAIAGFELQVFFGPFGDGGYFFSDRELDGLRTAGFGGFVAGEDCFERVETFVRGEDGCFQI